MFLVLRRYSEIVWAKDGETKTRFHINHHYRSALFIQCTLYSVSYCL